jgi:hypothetical protein
MADKDKSATGGANSQGDGSGTAADQDNNQGAGAGAAGQQQGQGSGTSNDGKQGEGAASGKTFTQEQLNEIIQRRLDKAEKDWQKKVKDAEDKAKLSDDERTKAELTETRNQLAERDRRDLVKEAAEKAGVKNPRLFYNAYKDDLETDDKGKITNLKDVLEAAKTESPELFGTVTPPPAGSADAGAGNGSQVTDVYTKEQLQNLSFEEIEKNTDKVNRSLAALK